MAHRLSTLQAHLNPVVLPAASATLEEAPRKPLPLYSDGMFPTLLTEEQKYEFVSSIVALCGQPVWLKFDGLRGSRAYRIYAASVCCGSTTAPNR